MAEANATASRGRDVATLEAKGCNGVKRTGGKDGGIGHPNEAKGGEAIMGGEVPYWIEM